ncbi:uncharacterized protein LOC141818051 isoform X2 [Curcuma longa]|uniref:uncharacterized protein LOC141818051 isoform X2 n=1 Tax=Curcuma longa TaxID=136217 RepID=UPI003D9ED361
MKTVLNSLVQIFPQIDMRILKAVANEFPMDADTAVEFILSDVIPIMTSEPVLETSAHVHAPPALVLDAHHPPTAAGAAADGSLRAEETREEEEVNPIAC